MSTTMLLVEAGLVLGILVYLVLRFWQQKSNLKALSLVLDVEVDALQTARTTVFKGKTASHSPRDVVTALYKALPNNSLVWKRLDALHQHIKNTSDAMLMREGLSASLAHSGASRAGAATDDARFWAGAFVFIGLTGTLTCLGFAVFSLLAAINPHLGSGASAGARDSVIEQMRSTFSSMGLAFVNTAAGVGLTVYLSGRINAYEKAAENFRVDLEEFSLLHLEPLLSRMAETATLPVADPEPANLDTIVSRLESLVKGFSVGLGQASITLETLNRGAQDSATGLAAAAETFSSAADHLYLNVGLLNERLATLSATVARQEAAQQAFLQQSGATLGWLHETVQGTTDTFHRLDGLREELLKESAANQAALLEQSTANHSALQSAVRALQEHGTRTADNSLRTFYDLKTEMASGLSRIEDALRGSETRQSQIVSELRSVLQTLGSYAEHVEDMLRSLPAAIGTEPILAYEDKSGMELGRMSSTLQGIGSEVVGLRGDIKSNLQNANEALRALNTKLENVEKGFGTGQNGGVGTDKRDNSRAVLESVKADVSTVAAQLSTMDARLQNIAGSIGNLDRSVVFAWGRKGKR